MALTNGIETVAFVTGGYYSDEYTSADAEEIASLYSSYGMLEDAPSSGGGFGMSMDMMMFM